MNTKQLLALSVVSLAAGFASAQTVPPEAWVGMPISTTGSTLSRVDVRNELVRTKGVAQAPQEEWIGSPAAADVVVGSVERAEVKADLARWTQAGLNHFAAMDTVDDSNPAFRQRAAAYERLREGSPAVASAQSTEASGN